MDNTSKDIHPHRYSLGIYVNKNAFFGGSGNPHVFLGLKIEQVKYNPLQKHKGR